MAYNYPPLDFVREGNDIIYNNKTNLDIVKENIGGLPDNITEDELIKFVLSKQFMNNEHVDKRFHNFNQNVIHLMPIYLQNMGITLGQLKSGQVDPKSEMKDLTILHSLIYKWMKYKQIYKPDPDFARALIETDKAKLTKENLERIPINDFYLDMSAMHYEQIHGTFVHVVKDENIFHLVLYVLTNERVVFSSYLSFELNNEQPKIVINADDIKKNNPWVIPIINEDNKQKYRFSIKPIIMLALQLIIYMSVPEKDMEESPQTKNTYRPRKPGSIIKNKYSEMQMFDVGIRYGSEFRKKVKELKVNKNEIVTMSKSDERHRSPQPHLRRAHWSHYWCGPESDPHLELRWIEPCFVGFNEKRILKLATIHTITGG